MPQSSILGKKYPVPILKPLWPIFAAGAVVYYGVWKTQSAMVQSDEYKNDPRNPAAGSK